MATYHTAAGDTFFNGFSIPENGIMARKGVYVYAVKPRSINVSMAKAPASKKDPRLARAGVAGFNKPKRTPSHPKKSHIVVAKEGDKIKTIRFGEKGAKTAGQTQSGRV